MSQNYTNPSSEFYLQDEYSSPSSYFPHLQTQSSHTSLELKTFNQLKLLNNTREQSSMTSNSRANSTAHHQSNPPQSSEEEKNKVTRRHLVVVLSICYAIFLVTFAAIIDIGNAVVNLRPVPQIFSLFLLLVSFSFFIFLLIHIRIHLIKRKKYILTKESENRAITQRYPQSDTTSVTSVTTNETLDAIEFQPPYQALTKVPHHSYCFITGRHGELLYLKLGAAWFCFGLTIHSMLSISNQIIYIRQGSPCADYLQLSVDVLFPLYSIFILFFIFKYCNIVINSNQSMAKVLLMHAIGTTLAFWIYSVVSETVMAINLKRMKVSENSTSNQNSINTNFDTNPKSFSADCHGSEELNLFYRYIEPYLYPFVVEFCILTVGIYYMMWSNVDNCQNKNKKDVEKVEMMPLRDSCNQEMGFDSHEEQIKNKFEIHADCHASSRGLFAGMLLMVFKIVSMILVHVTAQLPDVSDKIVLVDRSIEFIALVIMVVATIVAYTKTSKFDVNHHPISKLDDVLLFIAIPAFFSETIFSMVPAIYNQSYLNILVIVAQLLQILIQTPWIIDALRRCSNSSTLRQLKPGRELVTFLTIANVALWIYYTFTIKTTDVRDERYKFYGDELWSILNHLSLPLIMFYRFHSSVCLVDIWKHSYEKGEDGH